MPAIHGRGGRVYMANSAGTPVYIGQARSWKFTIDRELDEDNVFGDTWVTQLMGLFKWTGTIEGNVDTVDPIVWDAATSQTTRTAWFYPDGTQMSRFYSGSTYPKLDVSVPFNSREAFTMDFDGDGTLSRT